MLARGLEPDFSADAIRETDHMTVAASMAPDQRDLRALPWVSIDNDDSQDLDQLSVAEQLAGGALQVLVAIADVDALVRRGSAIDAHARANTTSVYTIAQVFPMLPLKLSTDLTSLAENQDRLAMVIDMAVNTDGSLGASQLYPALVRNHAKLAYSSVGTWLEGKGPLPAPVAAVPDLDLQLRMQDRAAQWLKASRQMHGALTLQTIEAHAVFDGDQLADLRPQVKNRAHELIEDFMIAANGVTARFLTGRGVASLRRVLRTPKNWPRIVSIAAEYGEHLPAQPSAAALNAFLARRREIDPAGFGDLSLCVIKLLGRGEYCLDLPDQPIEGHFGLAVSDYTHATAPNRRFPDLLTQRLLRSTLLDRPIGYSTDELRELANHCSIQEDNASKVERQMGKSAAALLLSDQVGRRFEAIVTGAAPKGTWVRIASPTIEGKLVRGAAGLEVGNRVHVKLLHTDVERGFIDFERIR